MITFAQVFPLLTLLILNGCTFTSFPLSSMYISSPAFELNASIPAEYTCDGEDIAPELHIGDVPVEAKSLALMVTDPDAPGKTWLHWIVWNIPPETTVIPRGGAGSLERVAVGVNDFGLVGYGGPCPPSGTHRYIFQLYALDIELDIPIATGKSVFEQSIDGHILQQAELIGIYGRR